MGLHQDKDEAALAAPVVSVSLGDDALFRIGGATRRRTDQKPEAGSGDVVMFGGPARLAYHGIDRILPGTSTLVPGGGRINLTLRRVRRRQAPNRSVASSKASAAARQRQSQSRRRSRCHALPAVRPIKKGARPCRTGRPNAPLRAIGCQEGIPASSENGGRLRAGGSAYRPNVFQERAYAEKSQGSTIFF